MPTDIQAGGPILRFKLNDPSKRIPHAMNLSPVLQGRNALEGLVTQIVKGRLGGLSGMTEIRGQSGIKDKRREVQIWMIKRAGR